jgi:hypothetical protein
MTKIIAGGVALLAGIAALSPSQAAGGCGAGWHRGPMGHCRRNEVVVPAAPVAVAPRKIYAPVGRTCPRGYHLGPQGRRCWAN